MGESLSTESALRSPSGAISTVLEKWSAAEIANSNVTSNAYLNNPTTFTVDGQRKNVSHYDRLNIMTEQFEADPDDPEAIMRQMHCIQMGIAGTLRTQCHIWSHNPSDYSRKRAQFSFDPLSNIDELVDDQLVDRFGLMPQHDDLKTKVIDPAALAARTRKVNERRFAIHERAHNDPKRAQGLHRVFHILRLSSLQREWVSLGVDYILHAAYLNGGKLDSILLLTPTTITEAKPFKPFKLEPKLAVRVGNCALIKS